MFEDPFKRDRFQPLYHLRSPALKGKYNDYGGLEIAESVENQDIQEVWRRVLAEDLVTREDVDNECHDPVVRRDSTLAEMLEACWEERLYVNKLDFKSKYSVTSEDSARMREEMKGFWEKEAKKSPAQKAKEEEEEAAFSADAAKRKEKREQAELCHPTPAKVTQLLGLAADKWAIDSPFHGVVRMRTKRGVSVKLTAAQRNPLEQLYNLVETAQSGSYGNGSEIWAVTPPNEYNQYIRVPKEGEEELGSYSKGKPARIHLGFILEEVWQLLLEGRVDCGWEDRGLVRSKVTAEKAKIMYETRGEGDPSGYALLPSHYAAAQDLIANRLDGRLLDAWFVDRRRAHLRIPWTPHTRGEQCAEWKEPKEFFEAIGKIAAKKYRNRNR